MSRSTFPTRLLAPRYWPSWVLVGLLWLLAHLPFRLAVFIGRRIGDLSYWLVPYRRHIVERNIALCFPELSAAEQRDLVRRNLRNTGRGLVEVGFAWWRGDRFIDGLGQVTGVDHIRRAQAAGKGVLLIGAHFMPLDLTGRVLLREVPFQVIYREDRNPVMEYVMQRARQRHFEHAFNRRDMRALIRGLREGRSIWYPPDQDYGRRHAVFAPFFGVPAATITLPSRLVAGTGAVAMTVLQNVAADGLHYEIEISEPLEGFPSGDQHADATRLNALIEAHARRYPDQYYWVHRRFKTRPDGEPPVYSRSRRKR